MHALRKRLVLTSLLGLLAAVLVAVAPSATAGTGGCNFSGGYGLNGTPGTTRAVGANRISNYSVIGYVDSTCTVGSITVTAIPTVSGTKAGTPATCFFILPQVPVASPGSAGCSSVLYVAPAVVLNNVSVQLRAEVVMVKQNGGYATKAAACTVTFNDFHSTTGGSGPRCSISG